jgi:AraC-like DNA-binding protein
LTKLGLFYPEHPLKLPETVMDIQEIRIKNRGLPTLAEVGVATQNFPHYTNDRLYIHRLDVLLLSFIMRGTCVHLIDDQRYPARGPSIGITHLDQTHCIFTEAGGIAIMNIYLDLERLRLPDLPSPLQEWIPSLLPLNPRFVNRLNRVQQLDLPEDSPLPTIAQLLDRELSGRQPGWEEAALACMRLFLTELCRAAGATGVRKPASTHPSAVRLERVRGHIDTHFREALTLEGLAEVSGLSRTYLCRAFRAYAGRPLFTYVQERRIQAAMLALRQSREKVIHIAADCGFNDLSYFNRSFRRFCGRTPQAYRKGNRE